MDNDSSKNPHTEKFDKMMEEGWVPASEKLRRGPDRKYINYTPKERKSQTTLRYKDGSTKTLGPDGKFISSDMDNSNKSLSDDNKIPKSLSNDNKIPKDLKSRFKNLAKLPEVTNPDLVGKDKEDYEAAMNDPKMRENAKELSEYIFLLRERFDQIQKADISKLKKLYRLTVASLAQNNAISTLTESMQTRNYKLLDDYLKKVVGNMPEKLRNKLYQTESLPYRERIYSKINPERKKEVLSETKEYRKNNPKKKSNKENNKSDIQKLIEGLKNWFDITKIKPKIKTLFSKEDKDVALNKTKEKVSLSSRIKDTFDVGGNFIDKILNAPEVINRLVERMGGKLVDLSLKALDFIWDNKFWIAGLAGVGSLMFKEVRDFIGKQMTKITNMDFSEIEDQMNEIVNKTMGPLLIIGGGIAGAKTGSLAGPWGILIGGIVGLLTGTIAKILTRKLSKVESLEKEIFDEKDPFKIDKKIENASIERDRHIRRQKDIDTQIKSLEEQRRDFISRGDTDNADIISDKLDSLRNSRTEVDSYIKKYDELLQKGEEHKKEVLDKKDWSQSESLDALDYSRRRKNDKVIDQYKKEKENELYNDDLKKLEGFGNERPQNHIFIKPMNNDIKIPTSLLEKKKLEEIQIEKNRNDAIISSSSYLTNNTAVNNISVMKSEVSIKTSPIDADIFNMTR